MGSTCSRRTLIIGTGAAVVGGGALVAGCGEVVRTAEPPPPGTALGTASSIPVGGGQILAEAGVVVCQPQEGVFKAFSSICTHRGCAVTSVGSGQIVCDCHHSVFSMTDGSVTDGPAEQPLPEFKLELDGDDIRAV
ncbi:Rieske (2Fe-2S) protein [Saccharothrix syringae]|uniref:Cytochrome bc1 complex Rieske iron-sulfur subunit n=1 Tax=Saccharothrix syringae TaxID=103733 RepID=A0A5Q0H5T2_SACSY|nr:Rieske (2Fe-2S) protein [Saccharothrix syringae]QFZ21200.1 Rieske (2Fe-2S) protein [Saccharothrix syringae]